MFRLRVLDRQGHLLQQVPLTDNPVTFGRDPECSVPLPDINISRKHAIIEPEQGAFALKDLGSTNGTWVNKQQIKTHVLKTGDVIFLGSYRIVVEEATLTLAPAPGKGQAPEKRLKKVADTALSAEKPLEKSHTVQFKIGRGSAPVKGDRKLWERFLRLHEISREIGIIETPEILYQKVLEIIIRELKADRGSILVPEAGGELKPVAALSTIADESDMQSFEIHRGVLKTVISELSAVLTENAGQDSRFREGVSIRIARIQSVMCVPLLAQTSLQGVLYLDRIQNPSPFIEDDLRFLAVIGTQVAISMANARLFQDVLSEKAKVQAIIENLRDSLVITDEGFQVEKFNNAAARMFSSENTYLADKNLLDLMKSRDSAFEEERFREAVGNGGTFRFIIREDDEVQAYMAAVAPFPLTETGQPGHIFSFRDATAFVHLELLKSEFIRNASHKLRTPLTVLMANYEILKDGLHGAAPGESPEALLKGMERNLEQLKGLVNRFVEFAELDRQRDPFCEVDLDEVIAMAWAGLSSRAEEKGVRLERKNTAEDELLVTGIPERLIQCFTNIIDNAIKFSPDGGRIIIRTEETPRYFRVLIQDEGPGIPPEHLPYIFCGFHQVEDFPTGESPGAGLGLTISKRIIHHHGGSIQAASPSPECRRGTLITVNFPRDRDRMPATSTRFLDTNLIPDLI